MVWNPPLVNTKAPMIGSAKTYGDIDTFFNVDSLASDDDSLTDGATQPARFRYFGDFDANGPDFNC